MTPRTLGVIAVSSLLLLGACGSIERPAATVDGRSITNRHVATDVALFTTLSSMARQKCATPERGESLSAACARLVLGTLIEQTIVERYARSHGVFTTAAQISSSEASLKTQLGGAGKVNGALARAGIAPPDFRDLARVVALFTDVQKAIASGRLTTAQLQQQYQQNVLQYTTLHADHILLKTRSEAERVYARVTAPGATPSDFMNLARRVSTDPSAKQNSGDLGDQPASRLDSTFVRAALALKPGDVSKPVHTQFGWHVIRLVSSTVQPFESVRPQLEQQLAAQAFSSWMREQLAKADVAVNPRYGRWDASLPGVVPVTSTATGSPAPVTPSSSVQPGSGVTP